MKRLRSLYIVLTALLLSSCGFHLRNGNELPPQLHTLYFKAANPYEPVATELRQTLTSLNVRLVSQPSAATYTLMLSKSRSQHSRANLSDTSQASSITYSQSVNVVILNNKTQKTIINGSFAASINQYLNQDQIMTASTMSLATESLPHNLVTHIFTWLTTDRVKNALKGIHYASKQHA